MILGLPAKLSEALCGPAQSEKAGDQCQILDLGSHNRVLKHDMCPTIFPQKSLHPILHASSE